MENKKPPKTIDEYIASSPISAQPLLKELRKTIREAAPKAEETISYQMPAFKQNGILIWFGAFKNHIGLFPKTSAIEEFKDKLLLYKKSKGTIRFPIDQPLPIELIKEIVKFRIKENEASKREL